MPLLEVSGLSKAFGDNTVLRDIRFSLDRGQVLSLIGSSGSGKTTLLRCLNFLEQPDGGRIAVDGRTVFDATATQKLSRAQRRENQLTFGLVFQSFNLFPQYTVMRNLTLAAELAEKERLRAARASREEIRAACAAVQERALDLLAQVGLSDKAEVYPCDLSGGQCQRAAIARALMLSPQILCFDEPTSALDPELTGEVLRVIRALRSDERTMIIVTHEMEFARHVSDKIIFMADGIITETGSPDELFGAPKSEKLRAFLAHSRHGEEA